MTSTIIEFPNSTSTPAPTTPHKRRRRGPYKPRALKEPTVERDEDEVHAQAFCDLEGEVCDLERMGQIAQDLIMQCVAREEGYRELELSSFAVMELAKMLRNFKDRYYKRWHGDLVGVS